MTVTSRDSVGHLGDSSADFAWVQRRSCFQLEGGWADRHEKASLTPTVGIGSWLGHIDSLHGVPGQHSRRIKVDLQGLLRASLGSHITSLIPPCPGQSECSEWPRECTALAKKSVPFFSVNIMDLFHFHQ